MVTRCSRSLDSSDPASDPGILRTQTGSVEAGPDGSRLATKTLLVTALPDLSDMAKDLGEDTAKRLADLHDRIVRGVMKRHHGRQLGHAGTYQMLFERPDHAVGFALACFQSLGMLSQGGKNELISGVGIHHGPERSGRRDIAAKLASLAGRGRILLTRETLDVAQPYLADSGRVRWLARGSFEIEGLPEPFEVFEVLAADPIP